ncbi:hypothetical protein GQ607_016315 [Colletotrichum asianum]|uniref:Clr5 domain-containing protein n=1 Tax=Colletotrichum asianum TaxID=702518 RepID=A0A8H3ZK30_9PEZI|nr:hypothetical protein GQ607_016315 [Colletotrichum asianum]
MASSSFGKRPSDAAWQKHRFTIERMFVNEKKSLVEIRHRLESDGFRITKAQLEYKLKLWGLRRRIPKTKGDAVWQFIGRRVQRRKQQGKETEVVLDKQIFDAAKVCKEIKRYQETTISRFNQLSPMTPEGLEISLSTPAPLPMRFLWPASMPWSRFQDNFPLGFSGPGLFKNMNNISKEFTYQKQDPSFTNILQVITPQYAARNSITQLAAEIGSIMPETHENEHFGRANRLLQGTADEQYSECIKVILYKISNNLFSVDEISRTEWESIADILETSDIMKLPLQLGNITDATMAAIMEKLFQRAMPNIDLESPKNSLEKFSDSRIITWSLQSGLNPDIRIPYYDMSALQIAARKRFLPLMSQLLDHGADPDLSYEPWDEGVTVRYLNPLLETVRHYNGFDEGHLGMIERLLKMSSGVSMESTIRMIMGSRSYFPELMEVLTRNGAHIFQSIKARTDAAWFIDTFSIIGYTVKYSSKPNELHPFFRLLEDAGIQNRSQIPEDVDTTSIVLLAAAEGNTTFLDDLHSYGIDITAIGNLGCSAIHVAAYYGHLETCEKLVSGRYAPLNAFGFNKQIPSLLHFAVAGWNLDIVRLFHQSKIDVNEPFEDKQGEWSVFCRWGMKQGQREWVGRSFTAVEVAMDLFKYDIAQYLLENGAKAPPLGLYPVTYHRNDDAAQELTMLTLDAGADSSWAVCIPSNTSSIRMCYQFRVALYHGNNLLARQLFLDAQENALWNDPNMSILEAAIITGLEHTVENTFAQNPGAYDPGALCAKVIFSPSSSDSIIIRQLLSNRPQSEETSPLEALAIGLAAWSGQMEVLKLLLAAFDQPGPAKAPRKRLWGLPFFSMARVVDHRLPFEHRSWEFQSISPTVFALKSEEALSLMLKHGYKPDRVTMRAAIADFDRDILKTLLKSPRLSNFPDYIQGPLSYAVRQRKYDVVRFLLENGEDVNEDNHHVNDENDEFDESARNPLQSAVENKDLYLIDLLLKSSADVNAPAPRRSGATASQIAAITGRLGILRTLIDHGADINAPGAESGGRTALEGAAEHGRIDMIQYLLAIGARTTNRDRLQYLRAIRYAQMEAHEVTAKLLRGYRDWTTDDQILWTTLVGLNRSQLESFKEETHEVSSSLNLLRDNMALKDNEVEHASTKDSSDQLEPEEDVHDPTEEMELPDDLQDLEIRTNDPMVFMIEEM